MSVEILKIESLNVAIHGTSVLREVSLSVGPGEIVGLVGASGSGKSMTALAVMQLLPPRARMTGAVSLGGRRTEALDESAMQSVRGGEAGMVFQEPMSALNPLMRIGEQIAETVSLHRRVSRNEARAQARAALDAVGLKGEQGALDRFPYELSGGQRQRVAIAMATVLSPSLLIADEPTTALDVITQAQVLRLLEEGTRARNAGLLLITHDLAVVSLLADRVAVMHEGQVVEQGKALEVLKDAQHPYTQSLIRAAQLAPKRTIHLGADSVVLDVRDVVKSYARKRRSLLRAQLPLRAVDSASLKVHAGETVGLVGESGSGKSTLLKVILALQKADSGAVQLLGNNFSAARGESPKRLRRAIQVVFQDPYGSFDPRWRVQELVSEPFFLMDAAPSRAERQRRVAEVLTQVGLTPADAQRLPHEFSGGQRQRIAIARALITQPAVIAFDEAVSALDVLIREQILKLLAELAVRERLSYLFVTHDLHVVRAIADRIYVMQRGQIVEQGETERVFRAPQHAYTRALIEATPALPL